MRYLSLFSGIEAVSVAWEKQSFECAAVAEILPYQSSVLKHHFPNTKNLGDVTKITAEDLIALGKIDIVVFGSPCQDMSIAGKRQGLNAVKEDENHSSRLFFEGVRVFRLAQKHCGARFMLWENVVGALSSQEGRDFGTVLETLVGVKFNNNGLVWGNEGFVCGRDSVCEWSVLDSQWFGVPQRRRRVFALLDTGDWRSRRPILLEAEHLRKVVKTNGSQKQGNSPETKNSTSGGSIYDIHMMDFRIQETTVSPTVAGRWGTGGNNVPLTIQTFDRQGINQWGENSVASTISARDWKSATDLITYSANCDHKVRRLTPVECERLQGFPDNWTNVGITSVAKRYNALGRSMAVPVMAWIGKRIQEVENIK